MLLLAACHTESEIHDHTTHESGELHRRARDTFLDVGCVETLEALLAVRSAPNDGWAKNYSMKMFHHKVKLGIAAYHSKKHSKRNQCTRCSFLHCVNVKLGMLTKSSNN